MVFRASGDVAGPTAQQPEARARNADLALARGQFFAGLVVIGFANGSSEIVAQRASTNGWAPALLDAFGISVIVWGALLSVLVLLLRAPAEPVRRADIPVAILAASAFLIPIPALSWLALAGMALYLLRPGERTMARAGAILLALTIPMFWARLLMAAMGNFILELDAALVGWLVGTERSGNLVPFADGSGALWIAPGCSSFDNVSLAVLCCATLVQVMQRRWTVPVVLWGLAACLAVIAVNTVRIGLIGLYPQSFELLHGAVGAGVAAWLTTIAIVALCHHGVSRSAKVAG